MEKQNQIIKVAIVAPLSIGVVNGGVRTQATETAKYLSELGVDVTFLSPHKLIKPEDFDIFHVFVAGTETVNIASILGSAKNSKLIVSPVFYSNRSASIIKNAIRLEKTLKIFGSGIRSEFSIKAEICNHADLLLPNTSAELKLVRDAFSIPSSKLSVVPNGVETRFTENDPTLFENKYGTANFVLFAGQASAPRKNVLSLLKIAPKIDNDIVIIGSFDQSNYSKECIKLAKSATNVLLIDSLDHQSELLKSAYAACNTFILPSQFETPGIAAMEAALAGANIVITQHGGTKDYFSNYAEYIHPNSTKSILHGINKSVLKEKSDALKNHILDNFTWQKVAEKTLNEYKKVLA